MANSLLFFLMLDENGNLKKVDDTEYVLSEDFWLAIGGCVVSLSVNSNGDINYNDGDSSGPYVLHLKHNYTHILTIREIDSSETWDYQIELVNSSKIAYSSNSNNFAIDLTKKYGINPIPVLQINNGAVLSGTLSSACKINWIGENPLWSFNDVNSDVGTFLPASEVVLVGDRVIDENGNLVNN